jgi:hypothetical protein
VSHERALCRPTGQLPFNPERHGDKRGYGTRIHLVVASLREELRAAVSEAHADAAATVYTELSSRERRSEWTKTGERPGGWSTEAHVLVVW